MDMAAEERLKELGMSFCRHQTDRQLCSFCQDREFGLRFRTGPSIRGKYVDYIGKVGGDISKEKAKEAARATAVT